MIGKIVNSRYRIDKKIGRGGFGTVYRCMDLQLKRVVALKLLDLAGAGPDARERFPRECEFQASLNHPNIVTVFDYGEWDGSPFLVMECIEGSTLFDLVVQQQLDPATIVAISTQVCDGMAYAHRQGVIHRDLTLRNILLAGTDASLPVVKILDFGLARLMDYSGGAVTREVLGTCGYMSPEQVRGEAVDGRTDIFAFGVAIYRMLCGRFPFEAEHPTAVMYLILSRTDLEFPPDAPPALRALTLACLEKDRGNRPPSFDQIRETLLDLGSISPGAPSVAGLRADAARAPARSSRRNPYLNRVMIKSPAEFFGREREINKIFSRLDAPHPQSISVVGERRIGKSSLLNYIYNRASRKRLMAHYEGAIFVYLDFQHSRDFTVERFIDFLFTTFAYETQGACHCGDRKRSLDQLKEVIQDITGRGKRIIVLMDEFEVITNNANFDTDFFSFLRSMANSYKVAYVTSSCQELQALCHHQDISDSPFFNIFSNLPLRPFTREEAEELVRVPSAREGLSLEPHADRLIALAGCRPMFLQIACSAAFESLLATDADRIDWDEVEATFREEAHPHFCAMWEKLDANEKLCLGLLARGQRIGRPHRFVIDGLIRQGYVSADGADAQISSSALRDFARQRANEGAGGSLLSSLARVFRSRAT